MHLLLFCISYSLSSSFIFLFSNFTVFFFLMSQSSTNIRRLCKKAVQLFIFMQVHSTALTYPDPFLIPSLYRKVQLEVLCLAITIFNRARKPAIGRTYTHNPTDPLTGANFCAEKCTVVWGVCMGSDCRLVLAECVTSLASAAVWL